jgi:hypothetical protein
MRVTADGTEFRQTIVASGSTPATIVSNIGLPALPSNTWTRVALEIEIASGASTATLTYGQDIVLSKRPSRAHEYLTQVEFKVGSITDVSVNQPFTLRFDDVVIEHD